MPIYLYGVSSENNQERGVIAYLKSLGKLPRHSKAEMKEGERNDLKTFKGYQETMSIICDQYIIVD